MTKEEANAKLEFLETSEEERAHGLRRIKRRHYTGPPDLLPQEKTVEVRIDADIVDFFSDDLRRINTTLRSAMVKETVARELLDDSEFIAKMKEKLAA